MTYPPVPPIEEIQRRVQEALKGVLPGQVPTFAKGVVEAPDKGWFKALYYDALTGEQFSFYEAPTVVAVALVREGLSRLVTAPTISIPTVEMPALPGITLPSIALPEITLPASPTISVPTITLPPPAKITVPTFAIPYAPGVGGRFVCGWAMQWICDTINPMLDNIDIAINRVNDAIAAINSAFATTRDNLIATINEISAFSDNAQAALNDYSGKIKTSVDAGLADLKTKTEDAVSQLRSNVEASVSQLRSNVEASVQAALNDYRAKTQAAFDAYRNNIQVSVNAGLSQFIPDFYDMMGLPPPEVPEADRKALMDMGDVNGDGIIDQKDIDLLKAAFGTVRGDPRYNEACDLNHDGVIDYRDIAIASRNYGKSIVPTAQLLSPAQLRNVTRDGFEFYGLSAGMKLCYVAVGRR